MLQGIQSIGKPIGILSNENKSQKQIQQKKEPEIGSLLSGKQHAEKNKAKFNEDKKPIENRIQNRLGHINELGEKNREKLNISA